MVLYEKELLERNKKTLPRQKEAHKNQCQSFLLLSNLGNNAVSSNAVDPSLKDTGYPPYSVQQNLGRIAPENYNLILTRDFIAVKVNF